MVSNATVYCDQVKLYERSTSVSVDIERKSVVYLRFASESGRFSVCQLSRSLSAELDIFLHSAINNPSCQIPARQRSAASC
jgi:hypothetical protein